jgi:hypothetical protein
MSLQDIVVNFVPVYLWCDDAASLDYEQVLLASSLEAFVTTGEMFSKEKHHRRTTKTWWCSSMSLHL